MKDLKKLRQARIDKAARGRAATTEYNTLSAKAERTEAEELKLAALDTELTGLEASIEELDTDIAAEEKKAQRAALFSTSANIQRQSFGNAGRTNDPNPDTTLGFKSLAHFANAVRDGSADSIMQAAAPATYNQNQGSSGEGYLVPVAYSDTIWELALANDDLLGLANPEPTAANAVLKPKDESTPWGSVGVQAYWRSEAATMTPSKYGASGETLTLAELYAFTAATNEVLSDAPMLENRLTVQAGRAIKWVASEAVWGGDGVGKPLGFIRSPALITVAAEAGQAATTVVLANLGKMVARVLRTGGRPMWIINPDVLPQLITMLLGNVPAWLPNNQPSQANPWDGTLLGYPVLFSEHAQTLGTVGDVSCVNMDGYYAATKNSGLEYASSMHLYFDVNMTAFRWTFRVTGQPILSAPVAAAKGPNTKSHFVVLAAR